MNPSTFAGDGRVTVAPRNIVRGTRPLRVRRTQARRAIEIFTRHGWYLSGTGGLLWVIITHCHEQGIGYSLIPIWHNGEQCGWSIEAKP